MSHGTGSSGWLPNDTVNYTNDDAGDPSGFEEGYGQDTGYANLVAAEHFDGSIQPSFITSGAISSFQSVQLPPENLYENSFWSDHSNLYSPGPVSSVDYRHQNL